MGNGFRRWSHESGHWKSLVTVFANDFGQEVALGQDADKFTSRTSYQNSPDFSVDHLAYGLSEVSIAGNCNGRPRVEYRYGIGQECGFDRTLRNEAIE